MERLIIKSLCVTAAIILIGTGKNYGLGKKDKKKPATDTTVKALPKKKKSFDDSLKTCKIYNGLFKIYQDTATGALHVVVKKHQLDKEYIYFSYSENAPIASGTFRGAYRDNKIFTIKKYFNKIEFITVNNHFYFDSTNALSRSANANRSESVLFSKKIAGYDHEKEEYLLPADDLFLTEYLHRVKPPMPRGVPADAIFSLGSLSKEKSKVIKIRNYPANTDVLVEYVFENPYPTVGGGIEVSDARNVSVQIQHTLIEMPQSDYQPRFDDPRVGYFITQVNDMTSPSATPYRDVIHRWHLKKKNPEAEVSDPIEPIVWWIENTTPKEWRSTIKAAALTWNKAFESAGFTNAIQVYEQPDTATWDAGDLRYNVLRWASSPRPIFGGYGPSFVNPRTGQILGADVMLEYIFLTGRLRTFKFLSPSGQNHITSNCIENGFEGSDQHFCNIEEGLHQQNMVANTVINTLDMPESEKDTLFRQAMYYLILHELGHTLGLNHNMMASKMLGLDKINNKKITQKTGLTGSVMDYPAVNVAESITLQGDYYTIVPGPYDHWAIEYGYREFKDTAAERVGLQKILSRSTEPQLLFGNDADDMRTPGMHIDPRAMIFDLSADVVAYSENRFKILDKSVNNLIKKYKKEGQSYQELRNAFTVMLVEKSNAVAAVSRYVGGVYINRALPEQKPTSMPFTPVPMALQKKAFDFVAKNVFAPDAFAFDPLIITHLQMQRRGFNLYSLNEDPNLHDAVLEIQKQALNHWLHPNVLKRLTDSKLYGNTLSVAEFMNLLTLAIFKADITAQVNTFRQNLQIEYVQRLANAYKNDKSGYDYVAQAQIYKQLKSIEAMLKTAASPHEATRNHRQYIMQIIKRALESNG